MNTPPVPSKILVLTLAFTALAFPISAEDWTQFRGPDGQGHSATRALPTEWSTTKNVVWRQTIPGTGWSSPILLKDKIFLTTAVKPEGGGDLSLRTLCLDSHSGKVLWDTPVFSTSAVGMHSKNSHASATPITDGERLYVHFGPYGTAALDFRGKVLWRNSSLKYPPVHGNGGSPALAGQALIFSCDGASDPFVVALNKQTGEVLWRKPRALTVKKTFSFCTPLVITVAGQTEVILPGSGAVAAYDPKDGREIWRARYGEGYSVVPRPVFSHGLLFLSSGFDKPSLLAIRPDGQGDVTDTHIAWRIDKGAPNTPSPLIVGDELYFISDAGIMTCADAKTGQVHWQERLGGGFSASPVFAAGRIYAQNEEGIGTVVKPGTNFVMLAKNDLKERSLASYALDENALYIRTAGHLYRVQEPIPTR